LAPATFTDRKQGVGAPVTQPTQTARPGFPKPLPHWKELARQSDVVLLAEGDGELAAIAWLPPSSRMGISMGSLGVEAAEWASWVWPETQMTIAAMTSNGLSSRKNRRIANFMVVRMRRR
jgi:hypothetical protein